MKRIDSCGSVTDLYSRHINSLSSSQIKFKPNKLSIACVCALTSFAASANISDHITYDTLTQEQKMP